MKLKNTTHNTLYDNYTFNCKLVMEHDLDSYIKAKRDIESKVGIVDISNKQLLVYLTDFYNKHIKTV